MNQKIVFTFFSVQKYYTFIIGFNDEHFDIELSNLIMDFIITFGGSISPPNIVNLNCTIKKTEELDEKVNYFINKHKSKFPQINKINDYLKSIKSNDYFYILPQDIKEIPQKNQHMIANELICLNNPNINLDELNQEFNYFFGDVIESYSIKIVDHEKKIRIGEKDKQKRICRFCKKSDPQTTFKKIAHAIPESLGNKNIILNEECDECNEYFSKTLEKDFLTYFRFFNTFYQIKNKSNSIPKIKQKQFSVRHIDSNDPNNKKILEDAQKVSQHPIDIDNFYVIMAHMEDNDSKTLSDAPPTISLKSDDKLTEQNLYKALVKFSLSILDTNLLVKFSNTLEWVRDNDNFKEKLPQISMLLNPHKIEKIPKMIIYMRNNEGKNLPYAIGEFHYTCFTFVFIIPTFNDELDFSNELNFENFKNFFKIYQFDKRQWTYLNWISSVPENFVFNMNFKPNSEKEKRP